MKKIEMQIECQFCSGTGVYQGMGERNGAAVVCNRCGGAGEYHYEFSYNEFTGKKRKDGVTRVYKSGYGFVITTGKIPFNDIGEIDMDNEGVSYDEFLNGTLPAHTESLACPMMADQGACHQIKGFIDECETLNRGSLLGKMLSKCSYQPHKKNCWERFFNQR